MNPLGEDVETTRKLRRRRAYKKLGIMFRDQIINGFSVVTVFYKGEQGQGASKLKPRTSRWGVGTATDLALENYVRKYGEI